MFPLYVLRPDFLGESVLLAGDRHRRGIAAAKAGCAEALLPGSGQLFDVFQREIAQGIHADIIREEPFTTARDSIEGKVYVMRWKKSGTSRKVVVEEIKEN